MPKNINKMKKARTNFDLTTDSQIEKWFNFQKTVLVKFKIRIAQLIAKISIRHGGVNQIRHSLTGHNHFLSKNKAFQ